MSESNKVVHLTAFGHALAGALGGVFSNAVVYPLDTAKTHIQAGSRRHSKDVHRSVLKLLLNIMKEEGFSGFYKGFGTSMVSVFTQQYAYFFFYTLVRQAYLRRLERIRSSSKVLISTGVELLLGAVAGVLAQLCTTPISVIATRQQIGHSRESTAEPSSTKPKGDSFIAVGRQIVQEHGVGGLWLGIKPSLVLTVNPAITYGVFERVKGVILGEDTDTKLSPGVSFMLGAFSKSLATIVTYPYIMAKVRVQTSVKDKNSLEELEEGKGKGKEREGTTHKPRYSGSIDVLRKVWKSEGFLGWYQGMGAQILKAVLTQALLFVSKDQFERYALVILTTIGQFRIPVVGEATVSAFF
ncbi:hypothetical protein Clacol_002589 [Clathrus columnatus]|uniref:Uncharacterized protein n=1 Tax=Clathrus columnatus TaxID=1419009 RepID=A0AAV5A5Y0_9AGAM|nr:hypothetical protein Clacol_002589 [Clathrus columnatus]